MGDEKAIAPGCIFLSLVMMLGVCFNVNPMQFAHGGNIHDQVECCRLLVLLPRLIVAHTCAPNDSQWRYLTTEEHPTQEQQQQLKN